MSVPHRSTEPAHDPTHWLISTQRGTCRGGSRRARRASSGRRRSRPRCRGGRRPVWKSNLRRVRPESPRRGAPDALVDFHTAGDRRPGRGGEPERPVGVARLEAVRRRVQVAEPRPVAGEAQRVQVRALVAAPLVRGDEVHRARRVRAREALQRRLRVARRHLRGRRRAGGGRAAELRRERERARREVGGPRRVHRGRVPLPGEVLGVRVRRRRAGRELFRRRRRARGERARRSHPGEHGSIQSSPRIRSNSCAGAKKS